ncbi:MAG: DUF2147 domain-containing protein [Pseudomonadales bacterium]
MRAQIPLFYAFISLFVFAGTSYADQSQIIGVYWFPDKEGQVEIFEKDGEFSGKVVAYDIPDQLDEKNPDPKLRDQLFLGSLMLEGFTYKPKSKRWEGGTIYDAREGKVYKCRLWFDDKDNAVLKARGYIGTPMLGRTEKFERVK